MNNLFDPLAFQKVANQINKEKEQHLRRMFDSKIKQSFLIEMLHKVREKLGDEVSNYYDLTFNNEQMVTGDRDAIEYDICRMIVGIHRSNSIFISDSERTSNEKDEKYKKQLINDVITHIRLRNYSSEFFRKKQIIMGDEFLYFPLPYKLFVVSVNALLILNRDTKGGNLKYMYNLIFNKSLAALSLIEGNYLDNAYPICRLIIELYFKLLIIEINPSLIDEHDKFTDYDMRKTCCGEKYPEDFEKSYNNRKNQKEKSRIDFLHYGWLDLIEDYHDIVEKNPYSINGIIAYLSKKNYYKKDFSDLKWLYRMCHSYTHGNVANSRYPLLHYFELSLILGFIIPHVYLMLCEHTKEEKNIEGIDILELIDKNKKALIDQYSKRTTENFDSYYSYKKLNKQI